MLPYGLSMLWESVDPRTALRDRFGFASLDRAVEWITTTLEARWGIAVTDCSRLVISAHNVIAWVQSDHGGLVVKWARDQERFASLVASTTLLRTAADHRVPVAAPIPSLGKSDRIVVEGPAGAFLVTVLPELVGAWLDVNDRAAVRAAGACLARLHAALGTVDHASLMPASLMAGPSQGLRERVADWLAQHDRGLAPDASRRLADLLSRAPDPDDEPQFVHNDFRAANLLLRDSMIIGVLDFDEVFVEHRVGDLAKASVYLGTLFTEWGPTPRAVRQTLREGYESVRPLGLAEAQWYEILVLWQGIMAVPGEDDPRGWASDL